MVGNFLSRSKSIRFVCEDLAARFSDEGWTIWTTSAHSNRLLRVLDMAWTAWRRRRQYDVAQVDVYSGAAFVWAEMVCGLLRRLGKPYILTLHGGNLPSFARQWPQRVRRLLRSAAAVTTPSSYLLEELQNLREDLRLIPNPLEVDRYPARVRSSPKPKIVWLRAFHSIYNPSLAPRVMADLSAEFPDARLTMLGPDKGDGSLAETRREAARAGIAERIEYPGPIPKSDVPSWLDRSDVFLNTTNVDNTPVSVLEAMACGLCVVSTNVGGIPHLATHEREALLVPPDDPRAMAEAVRRILTRPDVARGLSENGRRLAEKHDWSVVLPQWKSLVGDVESGRGARA
jgi:glycosyltransferase involved in cell wall biosynthesis